MTEEVEQEPSLFSEEGTIPLDIPGYGRKLEFRDLIQFHTWAMEEHEAWKRVVDLENIVRIGGNEALNAQKTFLVSSLRQSTMLAKLTIRTNAIGIWPLSPNGLKCLRTGNTCPFPDAVAANSWNS